MNTEGFQKDWSGDLGNIPAQDRQVFMGRVQQIARDLGTSPDYLMGIMKVESGINPRAVNPASGATGLIQFMPSTARNLGTSTEALKNMSALEQLDYVAKYLEPYKGKMNTPSDAYMAVFSPAFVGKGEQHVAYSAGQPGYDMNRGLDLNCDGRITNAELGQKVRQALA